MTFFFSPATRMNSTPRFGKMTLDLKESGKPTLLIEPHPQDKCLIVRSPQGEERVYNEPGNTLEFLEFHASQLLRCPAGNSKLQMQQDIRTKKEWLSTAPTSPSADRTVHPLAYDPDRPQIQQAFELFDSHGHIAIAKAGESVLLTVLA